MSCSNLVYLLQIVTACVMLPYRQWSVLGTGCSFCFFLVLMRLTQKSSLLFPISWLKNTDYFFLVSQDRFIAMSEILSND